VPYTKYAVYINSFGQLRVFGSEGCTFTISPDGFFTGEYMHEDIKLSYAHLKQVVETGEDIDARNVVRVFGGRLESNFREIYQDVTGENESHE
jgi:hypothetical protein